MPDNEVHRLERVLNAIHIVECAKVDAWRFSPEQPWHIQGVQIALKDGTKLEFLAAHDELVVKLETPRRPVRIF
jgi:hypothetical protein